jgi:hypothetical protein
VKSAARKAERDEYFRKKKEMEEEEKKKKGEQKLEVDSKEKVDG